MRVERNGTNEVIIHENVKTLNDYLQIQAMVQPVVEGGARELHFKVVDSISMPSAVIGLLLKLKNQDKVRLTMQVGDPRLYELLYELNLVHEFGVRQGL